MKLLVCGGRDFNDAYFVNKTLSEFDHVYGIDILIEGGAPGADRLARQWAQCIGIHVATVDALWGLYPKGPGNPAGPRRNAAMLKLEPDYLIAFPGGTGTNDMVTKAKAAGLTGRRYVLGKNGYRLDAF